MNTLPFPSDGELVDAMDVLHDVKAIVDSVRLIVEVDTEGAVTDLKDRAETVHRLCFALERMLDGVSGQLEGIHKEWLQRCFAEHGTPPAPLTPSPDPANGSKSVSGVKAKS